MVSMATELAPGALTASESVLDERSATLLQRLFPPLAYWQRMFLNMALGGVCVASLAMAGLGWHGYRTQLAHKLEALRALAAGVTQLLPGSVVTALWTEADRQTGAYAQLSATLRQAQLALPGVNAAYVLRANGEAEQWSVVAAAGAPQIGGLRGPELAGRGLRLALPAHELSVRPQSYWFGDASAFAAFAMIRDIYGEPVGILVLEFGSSGLRDLRRSSLNSGLLALLIFSLTWLGVCYVMAHALGRRVDRLRMAAQSIRAGGGLVAPTADFRELRPAAALLNELAWASRERDRLQTALSKYVSSSVARVAAESEDFLRSRGQETQITVLFADLYHFTELTESMTAAQVVDILNRCFSAFAFSIQKYNGIVDKFIGDGVMAIFNAPVPDHHHAQHAVMAAIEMQAALTRLRRDLRLPSLRIGVGINTGSAIVGNVGSEDRFQYTAIGQVVNLAARIEAFTRSIGGGIVVGSDTAACLDDDFVLEEVSGVRFKGMRELLTIHKVRSKILR